MKDEEKPRELDNDPLYTLYYFYFADEIFDQPAENPTKTNHTNIIDVVFKKLTDIHRFSYSTDPLGIDQVFLTEIADYRQQIAIAQGDPDRLSFGLSRLIATDTAYTPITGRYEKYTQLFCQLFAKELSFDEILIHNSGELRFGCALSGNLLDEEKLEQIPLTRIAFNCMGTDLPHWLHTSSDQIRKIMIALNEKIKTLKLWEHQVIDLNNKEQFNAFLKQVAEIHWWFAHAMPFVRGSAAIGEIIIKAIFAAKGLDVHPKEGFMLDCVALVYPSTKKFSDDYINHINIAKFDPATWPSEDLDTIRRKISRFFDRFKTQPAASADPEVKKSSATNNKGGCSLM